MSDIRCGECGAHMTLKTGQFGLFYGCTRYPECKGVHGAHQNSGKPLGIPANRETIEWRKKAHAVFDPYVEKWFPNRREGYVFLQQVMGMTASEAHIGKFDIEQCKKLIMLVQNSEKEYNDRKDLSK